MGPAAIDRLLARLPWRPVNALATDGAFPDQNLFFIILLLQAFHLVTMGTSGQSWLSKMPLNHPYRHQRCERGLLV